MYVFAHHQLAYYTVLDRDSRPYAPIHYPPLFILHHGIWSGVLNSFQTGSTIVLQLSRLFCLVKETKRILANHSFPASFPPAARARVIFVAPHRKKLSARSPSMSSNPLMMFPRVLKVDVRYVCSIDCKTNLSGSRSMSKQSTRPGVPCLSTHLLPSIPKHQTKPFCHPRLYCFSILRYSLGECSSHFPHCCSCNLFCIPTNGNSYIIHSLCLSSG
ncbi:unnamed protein product [Periconia digitata]|uniref:Uncharacterized protein n=1 Tax=Periconia digitata TaxID=1303443 RepID=A0A9W4UR05_9PLEO|nr:unnamed protein product [Periconia digitata]